MITMNNTTGYINCRRCNRRLRGKQSIQRGFGPVCAKKVKYGETIDLVEYAEHPEKEQNFMDELAERKVV